MTDEDSGGVVYEEQALAFDEYEKAAARALRLLGSIADRPKGRQSLAFSGSAKFTNSSPVRFQKVSLSA
jgi:hypothetical protein